MQFPDCVERSWDPLTMQALNNTFWDVQMQISNSHAARVKVIHLTFMVV